jgi:hypothetical protein
VSLLVSLAISAAAPMVASGAVDEEFAPIEVVASRKTYRLTAKQLRDAVETFQRDRSLYAPRASLAFESQERVESARALHLRLVRANGEVIELKPNSAGRFTLPTLDFKRGEWELRANKVAGAIRLRAITLSPDASETDRRLGDLRLNCRVMMAIVRHEMSLGEKAMLGLMGDACKSSRISLFVTTESAIATSYLAEGSRRAEVTLSPDRRSFRLPTYRKDFSNEARFRIALQ